MMKPGWMQSASCQFDVQLFDFSVSGLPPTDNLGARDTFLKLDFDNFKIMMTEVEEKTLDPKWSFSKRFAYKTRFLDKLSTKFLSVKCCLAGTSVVIGEATVDLFTAATGPSNFEITLHKPDQGIAAGVLKFQCLMKAMSEISILFADTSILLTSGSSVQMDCSPSLHESTVLTFPFSPNNTWRDSLCISFDASLWDLIDPKAKESIRFHILDKDKVLLGEASIPFRQNFSLQDNNISYSVPVKKAGLAVGELSGSLRYLSLPGFAQMSGGKVTDNCAVVGGMLLFPGLPYPQCFEEAPAALPVEGRDKEDCKFSGSTAFVAPEPTAPVAPVAPPAVVIPQASPPLGSTYESQLHRIPLPPHWGMRQDRLTGRPFFADHRVRQTCWEDPRFLPNNWDQRIDPKTSRVYFAYHKLQKTAFVDPRYLPNDWEMRLDSDGRSVFAYHPTRKTTFIDPRGLPQNISAALDKQGRMFFLDHATKSSGWEDPRMGQSPSVLLRWKADEQRRWIEAQVQQALKELNDESIAERNEAR